MKELGLLFKLYGKKPTAFSSALDDLRKRLDRLEHCLDLVKNIFDSMTNDVPLQVHFQSVGRQDTEYLSGELYVDFNGKTTLLRDLFSYIPWSRLRTEWRVDLTDVQWRIYKHRVGDWSPVSDSFHGTSSDYMIKLYMAHGDHQINTFLRRGTLPRRELQGSTLRSYVDSTKKETVDTVARGILFHALMLAGALSNKPLYRYVSYRRSVLPLSVVQTYIHTRRIHDSGFLSTSKSLHGFNGAGIPSDSKGEAEVLTVWEIHGHHGVDISDDKGEAEVLFLPNTTFILVKHQMEDNVLRLTLREE